MADLQQIKKLREKTGVGIAACKEALEACDGDIEQAELYLRKKGMDKAAKKADRATGEGRMIVRLADDGSVGVVFEVMCETDFAAKADRFLAMCDEIGEVALAALPENGAALNAAAMPGGQTVADHVKSMVGTIGENMSVRRAATLTAPNGGVVVSYVHHNNKDVTVMALELEGIDPAGEAVAALGRGLCMHVTAQKPLGIVKEDIPETLLAKEREVAEEEAKGKPENIRDKIVQGKLAKFCADNCLLDQVYVMDPEGKQTVAKAISQAAAEAGGTIKVAAFVRMRLGED